MRGDPLLVRVRHPKGQVSRKDVAGLTKQMRCEVKEERGSVLVELQSQSAVHELIERVRVQEKGWECQVEEKDPYLCLQDSINSMKREKKASKVQQEAPPQQYFNYEAIQYYSQHFPVFIRRAVESDEEDGPTSQVHSSQHQNGYHTNGKKYVERGKG